MTPPTNTVPGSSTEPDRPSVARAYDWVLGGHNHYTIDRALLGNLFHEFPEMLDALVHNRQFLLRAVRYLTAQAGIGQIIDLGCGLPTSPNVHQVAQRHNPNTRVVYVDIDPVVKDHGTAMLADTANTAIILSDVRIPEALLKHPQLQALIDFTQPVAVMFVGLAHFIKDNDDVGNGARHILRHIIDAAATPGSYLVVSHIVADDHDQGQRLDHRLKSVPMGQQHRTPAHVDAFFDGLEPVEPGLVNVKDWQPDPSQPQLGPIPDELTPYLGASQPGARIYPYGGILRKPSPTSP